MSSHSKPISILIKFIKSLICLHYWVNPGTDTYWISSIGKIMRVCKKCGKEKLFTFEPINYI